MALSARTSPPTCEPRGLATAMRLYVGPEHSEHIGDPAGVGSGPGRMLAHAHELRLAPTLVAAPTLAARGALAVHERRANVTRRRPPGTLFGSPSGGITPWVPAPRSRPPAALG